MIKPQGKNILLEIIEIPQTTSSGFVLSTKVVNGKNPIEEKAIVKEIGTEVTKVKIGDTVYFKEYNLDRIEVGSFTSPLTHSFLNEEFIIAIENV